MATFEVASEQMVAFIPHVLRAYPHPVGVMMTMTKYGFWFNEFDAVKDWLTEHGYEEMKDYFVTSVFANLGGAMFLFRSDSAALHFKMRFA